MTYDDVLKLSARLFEAGDYLLTGRFYNQAVARAYYGCYTPLDFWARRQTVWRWPSVDRAGTIPATHLPHKESHFFADYAFSAAGITTTHAMRPPNAREAMRQLRDQRMMADYRTHLEVTEDTARRMVRNAKEMFSVIVVEAEKVKGNQPIV